MPVIKALVLLGAFTFAITIVYSQNVHTASDTLYAGCPYWWEYKGFVNPVEPYSVVFTGTITKIKRPAKAGNTAAFREQTGYIKIDSILYSYQGAKTRNGQKMRYYQNQHYYSSNSFYDTGLKKGDKVVVAAYTFDGAYATPEFGIVKIYGNNDPFVVSLINYIQSGNDIKVIERSAQIWKKRNPPDYSVLMD